MLQSIILFLVANYLFGITSITKEFLYANKAALNYTVFFLPGLICFVTVTCWMFADTSEMYHKQHVMKLNDIGIITFMYQQFSREYIMIMYVWKM